MHKKKHSSEEGKGMQSPYYISFTKTACNKKNYSICKKSKVYQSRFSREVEPEYLFSVTTVYQQQGFDLCGYTYM